MRATYPVVKIPKSIQDVINSKPLDEFRPIKPLPPKKPNSIAPISLPKRPISPRFEKEDLGCAAILLVPVIGLLFLGYGRKGNELLYFFCFLFIIGIIVFTVKILQNNAAKEEKYKVDIVKFPGLLSEWENECKRLTDKYEADISLQESNHLQEKEHYENTILVDFISQLDAFEAYEISDDGDDEIQNRKYTALIDVLSHVVGSGDYNYDLTPTKGVSEQSFFEYLKSQEQFSDSNLIKIYVGKTIVNSKYLPDITIECFIGNYYLYIDIEIDEPYVGKDGTPIHYIEGNDEKRDLYFLNRGWVVVRFAEEQVVKYPEQCFKLLKDVISRCIIFDRKYLEEKLKNHVGLVPIKRWTKDEAHTMAFRRYRNTYLKTDFIEYLPLEEQKESQDFD